MLQGQWQSEVGTTHNPCPTHRPTVGERQVYNNVLVMGLMSSLIRFLGSPSSDTKQLFSLSIKQDCTLVNNSKLCDESAVNIFQ